MLHAQMAEAHIGMDDRTVYEYFCANCGRYVTTDTDAFLRYLVREGASCYCEYCDSLPDEIPEALDAEFITIGNKTFDVYGSVQLGAPLVLFTTLSQT